MSITQGQLDALKKLLPDWEFVVDDYDYEDDELRLGFTPAGEHGLSWTNLSEGAPVHLADAIKRAWLKREDVFQVVTRQTAGGSIVDIECWDRYYPDLRRREGLVVFSSDGPPLHKSLLEAHLSANTALMEGE